MENAEMMMTKTHVVISEEIPVARQRIMDRIPNLNHRRAHMISPCAFKNCK
jgi:hypothetical protein